jgi:hypothetical protein
MFTTNANRFLDGIHRHRVAWLMVVLCVLGLGTQSAWAQYGAGGMGGIMPYYPRTNRNNNNPNNPNSTQNRGEQPFQGTATIVAVGSLGLEVTDANGNNWKLAQEKNCLVEVTGTADPSFLKPDMLVKFSAQFDKKGKATAPLNELEIISPQAAMSSMKAEINGKKGAADAVDGPVIGHLKSIKNNELTVQNTNGVFTAELGSNPSIKVNVSDFRWAQPGDKVDAKGYYTQQGLAYADEIKITLSNPLGDNTKKKSATKPAGNSAATNK